MPGAAAAAQGAAPGSGAPGAALAPAAAQPLRHAAAPLSPGHCSVHGQLFLVGNSRENSRKNGIYRFGSARQGESTVLYSLNKWVLFIPVAVG